MNINLLSLCLLWFLLFTMILFVIYNDFGYLRWFWLFTMILVIYDDLVIYNDVGYLQWFYNDLVIHNDFDWFFTMILVIYNDVGSLQESFTCYIYKEFNHRYLTYIKRKYRI